MRVGAMRLSWRVHGARSLKDKRRVAAKMRDRVRARYPVAVSEVDGHDELDHLVLGVAAVSNDSRVLRSVLDKITRELEDLYIAELIDREVDIQPFPMDPYADDDELS
jgi:uncharacterized protein YlxP (DUF503 family)